MADGWVPTGKTAHVDTFARDHLPPQDQWPDMDFSVLPELAAYPAQMNIARELLDKGAERWGDRPCYHYEGHVWTYNDLLDRANRIAHVLVDDLGVQPGNRVMLRAPNNPIYVACWFAVMKVGAVAVATMPLLRWRELKFMSEKAEIRVALCDRRLEEDMATAISESACLQKVMHFSGDLSDEDELEKAMAAKPPTFETVDTAADDVCLIAFTSGTTGDPKGCMHFHRDLQAINDTVARYVLKPDENDVFTGSPPIAFTFGLGALVTFPMSAGSSTVLVERYTPETTLQMVQEKKVSVLFTAPTAYRVITDMVADYDISSLKKCVSAGETLPLATWQGWYDATGIRIIDGLGSTEILHIFITAADDDIKPGTTGKAIPGYRARVVDEDGQDCPPGIVGNLAVQGPTGVRYLDNAERQAKYSRNGWNFTGDSYSIDADGYFCYQARTDDMIISAGYNISGPEVEGILLQHSAVSECAVIGAPDAARGTIVKAYVVLRDGNLPGQALVKTLQDYVKAEIAPYKYPREIDFVDQLPKTHTGKIQRFALRGS